MNQRAFCLGYRITTRGSLGLLHRATVTVSCFRLAPVLPGSFHRALLLQLALFSGSGGATKP